MQLQKYLGNGITYQAYLELTEALVEQKKTSGAVQSEALVTYSKLNLHRMKRIGKTTSLLPELQQTLKNIADEQIWLLLTETWCGDAAQNLPILYLMAELNPKIQLRILLRDQHLELMDQYLTNGTRSIPKLVCFEPEGEKQLFNWGPRPAEAQALALELKNQGADHESKVLAIQNWYNADKGLSIQKELQALLLDTLKIKA